MKTCSCEVLLIGSAISPDRVLSGSISHQLGGGLHEWWLSACAFHTRYIKEAPLEGPSSLTSRVATWQASSPLAQNAIQGWECVQFWEGEAESCTTQDPVRADMG